MFVNEVMEGMGLYLAEHKVLLSVLLTVLTMSILRRNLRRILEVGTGKDFYRLLESDNPINALSLLYKRGFGRILTSPVYMGLRGDTEEFNNAILEVADVQSCAPDNDKYDGDVSPHVSVIVLEPDQVRVLISSLETFLDLNKQYSKKAKVSGDGKVINISSILNKSTTEK